MKQGCPARTLQTLCHELTRSPEPREHPCRCCCTHFRDGDTGSHRGHTASPRTKGARAAQQDLNSALPFCLRPRCGTGSGQDDGALQDRRGPSRSPPALQDVPWAAPPTPPAHPPRGGPLTSAPRCAPPALGWPRGLFPEPRADSSSSARSPHSPEIKERPLYQTRSSLNFYRPDAL